MWQKSYLLGPFFVRPLHISRAYPISLFCVWPMRGRHSDARLTSACLTFTVCIDLFGFTFWAGIHPRCTLCGGLFVIYSARLSNLLWGCQWQQLCIWIAIVVNFIVRCAQYLTSMSILIKGTNCLSLQYEH
jgi:hypothetical protein